MSTEETNMPLPRSLQEIVGALLFASEQPLTAQNIRDCVRGVAPEEGDDADVMGVYQSCTSREIDAALHGLEKELERAGAGFRLVCTGGTYRLQTAPACGRYVRALLKLDKPSRLSRASLETLAIVAYRQPITKAEVEQIRGVAVDTIMKTLVDLQLVRLVGKSELPGHPFLYGTTPYFLEHFGLSSLGDLNSIDPTLQRSDPKARAAAYRKPVEEKTELEVAADEAKAAEAEATNAAEGQDAESRAAEEAMAEAQEIEAEDMDSEGAEESRVFEVEDEEEDFDDGDGEDDDLEDDDEEDEFDGDDDDDEFDDDDEEFDDDDEDMEDEDEE